MPNVKKKIPRRLYTDDCVIPAIKPRIAADIYADLEMQFHEMVLNISFSKYMTMEHNENVPQKFFKTNPIDESRAFKYQKVHGAQRTYFSNS